MSPRAQTVIPDDIEDFRDAQWRREGSRQVEAAADAERFIERVGFAACLTDSRTPGSIALRRRVRTAGTR